MNIWNGLSESRKVEAIRAPDGLDYVKCIDEMQKTQQAVTSASSNTLDDVCGHGATTTEIIVAAGFIGNLTGNADTVTTNANLTGEITSIGNASVLDPTAISNKADTTIVAADYLFFLDATDGTLKKVDAGELLLPAQSGHSGEYLTTDGTSTSWSAGATAITTATTYYISTTGNDTTGDGSSGLPWATIHKALTYLDDKTLLALVTIDVEAGDYGTTSELTIDHPQGQNIYIKCDYLSCNEILTGTSTDVGYVDYSFTSSNPTRYHVGYYVLCHNAYNGTNPLYTIGVMKVQSIVGSVVTLRHTGFNSGTTTASGSVTMQLTVSEVRIRCDIEIYSPAKIEGLYVSWAGTLDKEIVVEKCAGSPELARCYVANDNGADNKGIIKVNDGCFCLFNIFGIYGTEGISVRNGSSAYLSYCAGTEVKTFAESIYGSSIDGQYVAANGGNYGLSTSNESSVRIYKALLLECVLSAASPAANTEGNFNSYMSYTVW